MGLYYIPIPQLVFSPDFWTVNSIFLPTTTSCNRSPVKLPNFMSPQSGDGWFGAKTHLGPPRWLHHHHEGLHCTKSWLLPATVHQQRPRMGIQGEIRLTRESSPKLIFVQEDLRKTYKHHIPPKKNTLRYNWHFIKGSLAEKLPIYEQHRRVIESLRNSRVKYNRCVIVESSTIAA